VKQTNTTLLDWPYLNRRAFLIVAAAAIPSLKGQASTPSCILASEQEEGPYYVDGAKLRGDITEGKPGVPLTLRVALVDAKRCAPLSNAALDIWHCDAEGVYSGFTEESRGQFGRAPGPRGGRGDGPPPPPPGMQGFGPGALPGPGARGPRKIDDSRFLRGVQVTDQKGIAEFATLYPGWYAGRAIHIHLKVHLGGDRAMDTYAGGQVSHTGQLFFPEDVTEQVAKMQPYAKHSGVHRTTQGEDGVFRSQHGSSSLVHLEKLGNGSASDGFVATVTIAVDPDLSPRPVRGPGRGPGGQPPF
jgi:protocatechuate 3,4-dioxygenase beta subunit